MAKSGSFTGSTNNEYIVPKITWSATQSISGNYSDVTATLTYSRTNTGFTTGGTWNGSITINGTKATGSKYIEITHNSNTTALTAKTRVYHNSNGSKSITISASGSISGVSLQSTTISQSITLDTIPRATTPELSVSSVNMGSTVTITLKRASTSFTHRLSYSFGSLTGQTSGISSPQAQDTSRTFTPPLSLANQIKKSTSGTCTITCKTYNGNTLIGTKTVTLIVKVPASVVPTISGVSVSDAKTDIAEKFGVYVQQKSKLSVKISASGSYGSTISSYRTTIQSVTYSGASFTSNVITASGTVTLKITVTDSRGRTASWETDITVAEYSPPQISSIQVYRIDTNGNASNEGERIAVSVKYSVASVDSKNSRTYKVGYKQYDAASFTQFASGTAETSFDGVLKYTAAPTISADYSYSVKFELADYFTTVPITLDISTAYPIMDFRSNGKGIAFGKVSEKDAFEVAMDAHFTKSVTTHGEIEVYGDNPHIDFHHANSTDDYTSRIIEDAAGAIDILAPNGLKLNGSNLKYDDTAVKNRLTAIEKKENVTLTANADRITNVSYTAKYNELLGMVFVRIYGKINAALNAGYDYDIFYIDSRVPDSNAALSVKCGKDAMALAKTSNKGSAIQIRPLESGIDGYDVYITGFWFV